jgi:hypothetical protein
MKCAMFGQGYESTSIVKLEMCRVFSKHSSYLLWLIFIKFGNFLQKQASAVGGYGGLHL